MRTVAKLWIGLFALIVLSPLGLILPARFNGGSAWGEWSSEEIQKLVGYVPVGMSRLGELQKAPLPDYAFRGQESAPLPALCISYVVSALVGVAVVAGMAILIGKALARRERSRAS
jgi:hypothetical protein